MGSVISGLGAGFDLQSVVTQLMAAERAPETKMASLRQAAVANQSAWTTLTAQMKSLKSAATALTLSGAATTSSGTSSDPTTIAVTAGAGAQLGTVSLTVQRLALAQQQVSGPVTGSLLVGAGQAVVTAGLATVGATRLTADSTTVAGTHTVRITTASAAASATGVTVPATSYSAGAADLTVTLSDGTATTATLGSYSTVDELVSSLATALAGTATVTLVGGHLQIGSRDQGSAATLTLSGGALAALGLTAGTTSGANAVLSVDGGASQTVTHLDGSTPLSLGGGLSMTVAGHLTTGTVTSNVVRTTGTSTLNELASALSVAGGPSSSSVFDTGDGSAASSRFVLGAVATGTAGALTMESSGIDVLNPSQLTTVAAARDASLLIAGQVVTRSSNTVTDLLPGVTLNLVKETPPGSAPVTVTVGRDGDAVAAKVKTLVDAVNSLVSGVKYQTAYNAATKTAGTLSGDSSARSIPASLAELTGAATATGATSILSQLGIQTTRDGTLSFDSAVFAGRLRSDPDGVDHLVTAFATSLKTFATASLDTQGIVTTGSSSAGGEIKRRQDQIDAFELRMITLQKTYSSKFAALDAMLGRLKSQQSRLASQISGLRTG